MFTDTLSSAFICAVSSAACGARKKTALSPSGAFSVRQDLRLLYEQLRQQALLGLSAGQGIALLLQRGMKAWIKACSVCAERRAAPAPASPAVWQSLPAQFHRELIVVLAGIALNNHSGEWQ
jgi:hypothetical protein